ncbi:MAG: M18 family aminopeptidase [Muribaculaceae bacterium]|nr:M18 family aminopeptidase [Muribaculaceae bacterium]
MTATDHITDLKAFLDASPVNFLAIEELRRRLDDAGFTELDARDAWTLHPGARHYVRVNGSAIMAFVVGSAPAHAGVRIISAHSDSPCFRVKPHCEIVCDGGIVKLNTEVYGGPILYTWFDRPLSLAGRAILRGTDPLRPLQRPVCFRRPLLTIPHLAIHFNRAVNEGNALSRQKDMLPVLCRVENPAEAKDLVHRLVARELGVDPADVLDFDLSLYAVEQACTVGLNDEFITSGRLDDLSMVHAAATALLDSHGSGATRIMAIFDNEETGSGTKQGAASPILDHLMRRICTALGGNEEDYFRCVADSFMVSADNAHGVHPNYVEKYDPTNHPVLGGGPVIKINANCKYMTDADSAAVFATVCERAGVPVQYFVNHSDVAGGSTLGNILTSQIPLRGVDMGAAVWAMHSARETASTLDHTLAIRAFTAFYDL